MIIKAASEKFQTEVPNITGGIEEEVVPLGLHYYFKSSHWRKLEEIVHKH